MKQAVLSQFDLPWLPITALIIFAVCFAMYVFYTFKKSNKAFYQEVSLIPLDEPLKGEKK
ncbi:MAG: cbb3-type cytochrome c oxidase subunit 3 [Bacteriovoracaceae bacterium]|nr:cbb3-type cytochrome c oxidase subunit 3 [Bacteriovoracaceae bacterium]